MCRFRTCPARKPTDLFYSPTFPDGSLYFWPVPTSSYGVQLETWALLNQLSDINDPVGGADGDTSIPPGYRNALMLSLAETLLPGASRQLHPTLAVTAAAARLAVFGNNSAIPRMSTQDSGRTGGQMVGGIRLRLTIGQGAEGEIKRRIERRSGSPSMAIHQPLPIARCHSRKPADPICHTRI